jgi:hypothetical protein
MKTCTCFLCILCCTPTRKLPDRNNNKQSYSLRIYDINVQCILYICIIHSGRCCTKLYTWVFGVRSKFYLVHFVNGKRVPRKLKLNILLSWDHRLYMELDLKHLFGLHVHKHNCTHWLRPLNPPPPRIWVFGFICEGAIGQPR